MPASPSRTVHPHPHSHPQVMNEAEANKERIILEASAEATSTGLRAKAQAAAILEISKALAGKDASEAAALSIAQRYIDMYAEIGSQSNTMIFNDRPADVNALMAQASAVVAAKPVN